MKEIKAIIRPANIRKRIVRMLTVSAFIAAFACMTGCTGQREMMRSITVSSDTNVFQRTEEKTAPIPGYADLHISSSLKTHRERAYTLDACRHGKPDFKMVLNIDGQAIALQGEVREENGGYVGKIDPEAGSGMRYTFREVLRLKPGKHTIKVAIPDDGVTVVKEVTLKEGPNQLVLQPLYVKVQRKRHIGFLGDTTFYEGISTIRLLLNGQEV